MKKIILSAVAVASLASASEQPYELGITLGGTAPQDSLKLENHKNIGLRFGMQNDYLLENLFDTMELSFERTNGAEYENSTLDTDINRYAVNMLHHYNSFETIRPYVLAGVGYEDFSDEYGKVNDSVTMNLGVGLKYHLENNWNLRAEIRDHVNLEESIEQELIYTVGIGYSFGEKAAKKVEKVIEPILADEDKDGVLDKDDKCLGTPKRFAVDMSGCPKDDDKDGIYNEDDSCFDTPLNTSVDVEGCALDSDGDGYYDGIDTCPNSAKDAKVDANGCEVDSDSDGIVDSKDTCPNSAVGAKVDASGCEIDSDHDGVLNTIDKCPNTLEQYVVDTVGCPINYSFEVKFDTNKDIVKDEYNDVLVKFVNFMNTVPTYKAQIQGHTDSMGEESYNMMLSTKRAQAVMDRVISLGVDASRLSSKGYGSSNPVASNDTYSGKMKNRRVEAKLIK